jgi:DNA-binding NarL/FixJ family response regulator
MIRALVADDNAMIRMYIRRVLESREDIEVCAEAVNGKDAVAKAFEYRPDLVILDLSMPVMDGFTAAVKLRKRMPRLPILFCSIYEDSELVKRAKRIGASGYLKKDDMILLPDAVDTLMLHKTTAPKLEK